MCPRDPGATGAMQRARRWRLADLYTLPTLEKAAVTSALDGFEELPPQSASGAQVLALVQEDGLAAKNEEAVFQWLVRWQEAAQPTQAELLAAMKHVRFATMDVDFVQTTVRAWPALCSQEGRDTILGSYLDAAKGSVHVLPRLGFGPRLVYVLGGCREGSECLSTVDVYDRLTDAWKQVSSMPTKRRMHGAAALDGKLYAMGGFNVDDGFLSTVDVYDPQSDHWQPLAEMANTRTEFSAAAAGGKIYVIGGESDSDSIATVEAFDPLLGAWSEVASMSVIRSQHAVAVVDGKIYVFGGCDAGAGEYLNSVEMYNPQTDSWQQVASMPGARNRHAATTMGGKIYVSGSGNGNFTNALIVFDPQANTWTQLASMGSARGDHASAAIGGKLYVFGGWAQSDYDTAGLRTASVEAYDPISNTWAHLSDLTHATDECVAVAL